LLAVAIVAVCLLGAAQSGCSATTTPTGVGSDSQVKSAAEADDRFARAFAERAVDRELEGVGTVSKLLTDDTDGAEHQRFIVRLDSGQTVLVTHNVDVAPRVRGLGVGDTVAFKGEYVWNAQGGLMHWTHHDPSGSHIAGWIKHDGRTYQ